MNQINNRALNRDSNVEFLRLVCMLFIVIHHFLLHALFLDSFEQTGDLSRGTSLSILISPFVYIGVNVFVLISGYYVIRFSWRKLFKLYCLLAFYNLIVYVAHVELEGLCFGRSGIAFVLLPFSHCGWWFMSCYVILFLLTPILNAAIEKLSKQQLLLGLILLTVVNVYFGYFRQNVFTNVDGCNVMQFVWIYLIGGFLRSYVSIEWIKTRRWVCFGVYVIASLSVGLLCVFCRLHNFTSINIFQYNNPLIVLSAIAFFFFAIGFQFQSRAVNWLAEGAVAGYLLQDHQWIGEHLYPFIKELLSNNAFGSQILLVVVISVVWVIGACLIDKIRHLSMIPVWKIWNNIELKFLKK